MKLLVYVDDAVEVVCVSGAGCGVLDDVDVVLLGGRVFVAVVVCVVVPVKVFFKAWVWLMR